MPADIPPLRSHTSHHILASYSLGAGPSSIETTYARHAPNMKPAIPKVEPMTPASYFDSLGKLRSVEPLPQLHCAFYAAEILRKGAKAVLEEFVFAPSTNLVPASSGPPHVNTHLRMLSHLLARLVHPLIHAGNGLESGLSGLPTEGLGQAPTHPVNSRELVPLPRFEEITPANAEAAGPQASSSVR
uniref:Heat shock protein, hsp40 n=1 Tax=Ganoderma boninense TaxID=34458 RepID=A0A5K1K2T1_9APHY|nr:Heat shock protein, hsp40 [Ganoderma boninense]